VAVLEVRWEKGSTLRGRDYIFVYGKWKQKSKLGSFLIQHRIVSAVTTVLVIVRHI
jgi:hypothetical protein